MLSIGAFSKLCRVSTKTLRYYAEIGLLMPSEINPVNGYRYYAVEQLETMLFINRMKGYSFSLDEIRELLKSKEAGDQGLCRAFLQKKGAIEKQMRDCECVLEQLGGDLEALQQGRSIMAYMEQLRVQLVKAPDMRLLSVRKMVQAEEYPKEYAGCFGRLFQKIAVEKLNMTAPPDGAFPQRGIHPRRPGYGIRGAGGASRSRNKRLLPRAVFENGGARGLRAASRGICKTAGVGAAGGI